jgi:TonB-linked SusC/RagA family outer membrane protein
LFDEIENVTEFGFLFKTDQLDINRHYTLDLKKANIDQILNEVLDKNLYNYTVIDRNIVITLVDGNAPQDGKSKTVSGKVTDSSGATLPGVSVVVKGTTNGSITDTNGNYSLSNISANATLQFSFVGMKMQEIAVGGKAYINVTLVEDAIGLDEIVAIGYGTQKKVNLTGAVSTVKGEKLVLIGTQTSQVLQGVAAGLTAIQSSGQPGQDGAQLFIRGRGSIGASNSPLILIDGVQGDINLIAVNDIASVSVIKDAASASIYGARAANGVILVTTKRAKSGEMTVNFNSDFGWQKMNNLPKFLGALDYMKYSGSTQQQIDTYAAGMKSDPDLFPDTDWVGQFFTESGFQQRYTIGVQAGTEKLKTLASLAYSDQSGNVVHFNAKRYTGRINTDFKFSKIFEIKFDVNFSQSNSIEPSPTVGGQYYPEEISSGESLVATFGQIVRIPPVYQSRYSDGSWGDGFSGRNPIAMVNDGGENKKQTNYFVGIIKADLKPLKGLNLSLTYSPTYSDILYRQFVNNVPLISDWGKKIIRYMPGRNYFTESNPRYFSQNFNFVTSYARTIDKHNFNALVGYESIINQSSSFQASRFDYILPQYQELNAGSQATAQNSGSATHNGLMSLFGRLNYAFDNKYLLEFDLRNDASSRFAPENRSAYFPGVSLGWRMSEEPFIKNLSFITNLKLRASWGRLGNQDIGSNFPYTSLMNLGGTRNYMYGTTIATGASMDDLANGNIQWETTESTDLGLDFGFFNQRLNCEFDVYSRKTYNMLLKLPIPLVVGLNASMQNAGSMQNQGFDLALSWKDKVGDFSYSAQFIVSKVKNELLDLANIGPIISGNSYSNVGLPYGLIYGYESIGIFQDAAAISAAPTQFGNLVPGNIQYKDQPTIDSDNDGILDKGDGKINSKDRVTIGNPFPELTYALNLSANYKNFDLSIAMDGVGNRDVLLLGDAVLPLYSGGKIQEWHVNEFWSPTNTSAYFPKITATSSGHNDAQPSSTWVFNASYFKVRNIALGYTLKNVSLKDIFNNLRVYLYAQNVFTVDNLPKGIDPMIPNGSSGNMYPIPSVYGFGINLNF